MEEIDLLNIERVLWCCRDRGITVAELASEIQITPEKMDSILIGSSVLSVSTLQRVAKYFNRGLLFFLEAGPVDEFRLRTAGFRTLSNEHPKLSPKIKTIIERVERQRKVFISLKEDLDDHSLTRFSPPALSLEDLPHAASTIRNWLGVVEPFSFDSYRRAIENKGVIVFRSNGYNGAWQIPSDSSVCGFSIIHDSYPIIFIRKENFESRQLFTLIHELAHLLLHKNSSVDEYQNLSSNRGKEREANVFAGQLLVPPSFLNEIDLSEKPDDVGDFEVWLQPYRNRWAVSTEVILRRLLDAGRLDRRDYVGYREWKEGFAVVKSAGGSRQWRYREPRHIFGDQFVKTVLDSLHTKQITIAKACSFLDNLKVADVHKLERFYYEAV